MLAKVIVKKLNKELICNICFNADFTVKNTYAYVEIGFHLDDERKDFKLITCNNCGHIINFDEGYIKED